MKPSHKSEFEPQMDTDGHGLILKAETEAIIGCGFEVLNILGHGLLEKPYENALVVEFGLRTIRCEQQRHYDVLYKTVKVGEYEPDLIAFGAVVVDAKVIERITDHELGQNAQLPQNHRSSSRPHPQLSPRPSGMEKGDQYQSHGKEPRRNTD
jgi:GxxExxY protein